MKCYQHHDKSAIGTCKHCCKGLCPDCAADTGNGLACHEHKQAVNAVNKLIDTNLKAGEDAPINALIGPIFNIIMGAGFIVTAFLIARKTQPFLMFLGSVFVLFGVIQIIRNRKIFNDKS